MAKGYQAHQERVAALSLLGKPLSRRAGSKCELCETGGASLNTYEIPPAPKEPDIEHTLLLCDTCHSQIDRPQSMQPEHWRCLYNTVWSDAVPVQAMALRILQYLSERTDWASDLIEQVAPEGAAPHSPAEEIAASARLFD